MAKVVREGYRIRGVVPEQMSEWRIRNRGVVCRHRRVAWSKEWEDTESLELYVKQETVSTGFNSKSRRDEPGDRTCVSETSRYG